MVNVSSDSAYVRASGVRDRLHAEVERAGRVSRQPHDDDLVGMRGKHLALVPDALLHVSDTGHGVGEIEFALVLRDFTRAGIELEPEITERLVRPGQALDHHVFLDHTVRLGVLPREAEGSGSIDRGPRARPIPVDGESRPHRVLVQLDPLVVRLSEDHGAETTIADR
jgi:hypothetical protein